MEGVGTIVKHLLGEAWHHGLDAKVVAEPGIRFLVAKEHDGVLVDISAEEGGSAAGA
jgi:hypothetical protein